MRIEHKRWPGHAAKLLALLDAIDAEDRAAAQSRDGGDQPCVAMGSDTLEMLIRKGVPVY